MTTVYPTFTDAAENGFSPEQTGLENQKSLQKTLDKGGTIQISRPGTYKIAGTLFIGSHTSLVCGNGVFIKKVNEEEAFTHVLINKGALSKTYDSHITITGLNIIVNDVDVRNFLVYGLHGQLAFFYIEDLKIERFRCYDLGPKQYGIHICTFENILIDDVIIKGEKDGVHLGRGKRFTIRNGIFQTFDDAIALNGHDYSTGNPELGWIENGVIENCTDLDADSTTGFFCRILAGAWTEWQSGMEVQQSDSVISQGKVYRVQVEPDGKKYISSTRPTHKKGSQVLDGITWGLVQRDGENSAGVRNVVFRDIFLEKARTSFSIHFDNDKYSRSYYPGAIVPTQERIHFDNIRILNDKTFDLIKINTPVNLISLVNSSLKNKKIRFSQNEAMNDYGKTTVIIQGCDYSGKEDNIIINEIPNKKIDLICLTNIKI